MKQTDLLNQLYKDCGLVLEDTFEMVHKNKDGSTKKMRIITRSGIEKIQAKNEIKVQFTPVSVNENFAAVKATGILRDPQEDETKPPIKKFVETFGSAKKDNVRGFVTQYLEMAEWRALSRAVLKLMSLYQFGFFGEDEEIKDKDPEPATEGQLDMIESLLRTSILDEQDAFAIDDERADYTGIEANECIEMLKENQKEPLNPSQKDINKKLDYLDKNPKA